MERLRTVLLWMWFIVFAFLLIMIRVLMEMHEDCGLFVVLEIVWIAILIAVGWIAESLITAIQKCIHFIKYVTKVIVEDEKFGRMTFYSDSKYGTIRLLKPRLPSFGKDEVVLTICNYSEERKDKIFRTLEQVYKDHEKIRKGLCECVLRLYASEYITKYVEENLCIDRIVIDGENFSAEVYVDMNSKAFDRISTERLCVRAYIDFAAGEFEYCS